LSQQRGSLIIVDDNQMNRDALSRRLERKGYTVQVAEDGQRALALISQHPFDLVLLDVEMPVMSGLDVLKVLRDTYSPTQMPIIMVTAKTQSADIVEALRLGANDYITKPIDFPVALARIHTQLSHKWAVEALRESEERYALAVNGANDGLWDWNLKTNEVYFSARWQAMLGFQEGEIGVSPEEWFTRVHPEDLASVKQAIMAHLEGTTAHFEHEYRMLHQNGTYRWILSRGLAVRDSSGCASRIAGSQTDITAGKVIDPLTGLPNRLLFVEQLDRALKRTGRHPDYVFALLFLDLDRFKVVNDSLGPGIGDQLLIAVAQRLQACLRSTDTITRYEPGHTVARLEGDAFAILLDDITHVRDATRVAERLLGELTLPFLVQGHEVFTSATIGIAVSATGYNRPEEILRDADTAMHRAKALGKTGYELFDAAMRDQALCRMHLELDLRKAIEHETLQVYYQPIVALDTGIIHGFEALVRWQHPQRGLISPEEFIPIAEETKMILPLGSSVLSQACRQMKVWQEGFGALAPSLISVNLSSKQFAHPDLVQHIHTILLDTGLAACCLKLEITESAFMEDLEAAIALLWQLKSTGIQLSIDDFGTGYSSLSYLYRLPVDTLKIDRSFVSRLGAPGADADLVGTIVSLAHRLQLDVIAEGVETAEQVAQLQALACEYGQGYYFSRPMPAAAASSFIESWPEIRRSSTAFPRPPDPLQLRTTP
jgi:diguanylate cyclase (GGDEF)-like protein/PAS domain S-box-containing protein